MGPGYLPSNPPHHSPIAGNDLYLHRARVHSVVVGRRVAATRPGRREQGQRNLKYGGTQLRPYVGGRGIGLCPCGRLPQQWETAANDEAAACQCESKEITSGSRDRHGLFSPVKRATVPKATIVPVSASTPTPVGVMMHCCGRPRGDLEPGRPWRGGACLRLGNATDAAGAGCPAGVPARPRMAVVTKLGYTFGLIAVTLGRQQLNTDTTLSVLAMGA